MMELYAPAFTGPPNVNARDGLQCVWGLGLRVQA